MSNGFASALEISAKIVRDNGNDHVTARRLITERMHGTDSSIAGTDGENGYLLNMREGYKAALVGLYTIARRGQE